MRDIRKLAVLQLALVMVAAVMFYLWHGVLPAVSAVFGGAIALVNVVLLRWRQRSAGQTRALSAGESIRLLYRSALERFVVIAALFMLGMGVLQLDALALLTGFIVGQLALFLPE